MILDTSFLVALLQGKDTSVQRKSEELDNEFSVKAVSSVTVMEIWRGVLRSSSSQQERKRVEELLESLLIYTFSKEDAMKAAEIEQMLLQEGKIIDLEDIMIAATALVRNQPILTKNIKHFKRVHGLSVETV